MTTKEEARVGVAELVARYQALTPAQVHHINEEATKQGYILPLVRALGWNPEDLNEVSPEERASNGRVDYAFKLQGVSQFYLEAKGLGADVTEERWARQAITYALHQGVKWAVLCNFNRLVVFNANARGGDTQSAIVLNLNSGDYAGNFDRLWLLSKDATENHLLEEEARKDGRLPERVPIEKRLYAQLREWRERLWNETAQYKEDLRPEQIDEIIQRFFNRLIFIRTCEDRGLEEHRLRGLLAQYRDRQLRGRQPLLAAVRRVFDEYRQGYDSELFEEHMLDEAHIDEPTLAEVLEGLHRVYGSLADYDFSLISADVLGAVYEQYLGHVAQRAKQRQQALQARLDLGLPQADTYEVMEKRQRRKEQGIYYTPQWVVDYIVGQTVGRFIQEHRNRPDAIAEMKVLDMSCGSGSFLIRAYDALLRHQAELAGMPVEHLTQEYRIPLLRHSIYGVDLDQQAVEIARLNLLLRALATRELLPPLRDNVRRGNSLISSGEADLRPFFGDGSTEKQPFDWEREFPDIMKTGGFDVIVGNPPYVRIQSLPRDEVSYYNQTYQSATGNYDIYLLFVEKGLELLKPGGSLGFILPNKFMQAAYGKGLRTLLGNHRAVEKIVDFGDAQVFETGINYTCLLFLSKAPGTRVFVVNASQQVNDNPVLPDLRGAETTGVWAQTAQLGAGPWAFGSARELTLREKLTDEGRPLGVVAERIFQGLKTSADKVYVLGQRRVGKDGVTVHSESLGRDVILEPDLLKPLVKGGHVRRYNFEERDLLVLFPYVDGKLVSPESMEHDYPQTWQYLLHNRQLLQAREGSKLRGEATWYSYIYPKNLTLFNHAKILTPDFASHASYSYDQRGLYWFSGGAAGGYGILLPDSVNPLYVLGLLNSRLLDWYLRAISSHFRGGYFSYEARFIRSLPIRVLDLGKPEEKRQHDNIVGLVEEMLGLQARLGPLRNTPSEERAELERRVAQVDRAIDVAVYALYGLTDAERQLVEG